LLLDLLSMFENVYCEAIIPCYYIN